MRVRGVGILVVEHKDFGVRFAVLVLGDFRAFFPVVRARVLDGNESIVVLFNQGQIFVVDIKRLVEGKVFNILVVVGVFPSLVIFQLVPRGHRIPLGFRFVFAKRACRLVQLGNG